MKKHFQHHLFSTTLLTVISVHYSLTKKCKNTREGSSEAASSVPFVLQFRVWTVQLPVSCLLLQLASVCPRQGNVHSGHCSAFCWGNYLFACRRETPGLYPHLSAPTAGAGENQSVPPSSWWTHTLLWLSPRSWLSSWGSVQTPPGSTSLLLPEAGESVPPFWPVLVDTRTSLQAPPSLQMCMATYGVGGWEHHLQLLYVSRERWLVWTYHMK